MDKVEFLRLRYTVHNMELEACSAILPVDGFSLFFGEVPVIVLDEDDVSCIMLAFWNNEYLSDLTRFVEEPSQRSSRAFVGLLHRHLHHNVYRFDTIRCTSRNINKTKREPTFSDHKIKFRLKPQQL